LLIQPVVRNIFFIMGCDRQAELVFYHDKVIYVQSDLIVACRPVRCVARNIGIGTEYEICNCFMNCISYLNSHRISGIEECIFNIEFIDEPDLNDLDLFISPL